ncbi:hypothetical protein PVAG01_08920 [Phlyctema vagabunda]|uniref:Zn(2)-C6 fungal-type domain-containing protein n=1 Tax=Phlyctema vagabunda TaxID=108571 RepID=A0ABR4PAS1_9HELO
MEPTREQDSDNELRLEDITRRSACDRCRGMKTRCERSQNRGIAQLAQCRRCVQAQVKCITTLEAQPQRNQQGEKTGMKNGKRARTGSFETYNLDSHDTALSDFDQQYHNMLLEYNPRDLATFASMPAQTGNDAIPPGQIDLDPWHGMGDMVNLDECPTQESNSNGGRSTPTMRVTTGNVIRTTNQDNTDSQDFMGRMTPPPTAHGMAKSDHGKVRPSKSAGQGNRGSLALAPSPSFFLSGPPPPQPVQQRSIMDRLMEFNTLVSQDLQRAKENSRSRGGKNGLGSGSGSVLARTLQHSEMFLEIIGRFKRSREGGSSNGTLSGSEDTGRRNSSGSMMEFLGDRVDTDVALQLLSCNISVGNLFEILSAELAVLTSLGQDDVAQQALPDVRLVGLQQQLDVEMRVSLFAHVCGLMFLRIQKELGLMRGQELLTPAAEKTFQAVLGGNEEKAAQIVENLRRFISLRVQF